MKIENQEKENFSYYINFRDYHKGWLATLIAVFICIMLLYNPVGSSQYTFGFRILWGVVIIGGLWWYVEIRKDNNKTYYKRHETPIKINKQEYDENVKR